MTHSVPMVFCDITTCDFNYHNKEYGENFCNKEFIIIDKKGSCEYVKGELQYDTKLQ